MKKQFSIGEVKKLRLNSGLSQWRVARALGRTQGWLSNIESEYVTPDERVLANILHTIEMLNQKRK
jgi:transcriptional regulator with XRE-family HTH domain